MTTRSKSEQTFAKMNTQVVYQNVIFPFLTKICVHPGILSQLLPNVCNAKRVRNSDRYKYEDHTYTVNSANIHVSNFDTTITKILTTGPTENLLLGTYFASNQGVFSACVAPASIIAKMFNNKPWEARTFNNSYESGVQFKTLPFEEVRSSLSGSNIPFLFWSSKRNYFEISNAMRFGY